MRQPHCRKSARGMVESAANIAVPIRMPRDTPSAGRLVRSPRWRGVANSAIMVMAPPNSAPAPMLCTSRSSTSRIGAQTPIAA